VPCRQGPLNATFRGLQRWTTKTAMFNRLEDRASIKARPWYNRAVIFLSQVGLAGIIGTAIYCIGVRARYERSYGAAFVLVLFYLAVMLIAWAQQAIAVRDAETWREMVECQIRAAQRKVITLGNEDELQNQYFEYLIRALVSNMKSTADDDHSS
jgi:hypothetical protein